MARGDKTAVICLSGGMDSTSLLMHVLVRGNPHVEGDEVRPGFPEVLSPPEPEISAPKSGDRKATTSPLSSIHAFRAWSPTVSVSWMNRSRVTSCTKTSSAAGAYG